MCRTGFKCRVVFNSALLGTVGPHAEIMSLIVQKFGGTSVGTIERIGQVADKVARFRAEGHDLVVVVSAMSGETNRLIALAHEVQERPVPRELDVLISTGEQVTTALLSMALNKRGVKAKSYNGSQVRILTDDAHTKARIREIDDERLHADLEAGYVMVVAGLPGRGRERQYHHPGPRRFRHHRRGAGRRPQSG